MNMEITADELQALRVHDLAVQTETLDDLLIRWHAWTRPVTASRGYGSSAPGCSNWRCSRQYDDANGALDEAMEHEQMRQVDHEIMELRDPYRAAVIANARNLATGIAVWSSPRLPQDPEQREAVLMDARQMLTRRLKAAGLM
jgi:hypothetical protein